MSTPSIFGREPAAWVGLVEAVLTILLAFAIGVSQETYGPILAVVTAALGVYTALVTRDTALGAIVGLVKAVLVLSAVYGLTLTDGQTAAIISLVTVVVGFFQRTQTSPVDEHDAALRSVPDDPSDPRPLGQWGSV